MMRLRSRILAAGFSFLVGCTSEPPKPDVLLIVMDTVRADRMATYGHSRSTSNQLDAIATAGVKFLDATASGTWTWPSHAALFTGEPPWQSGAHWASNEPGAGTVDPRTGYWRVSPMRDDLPTLAERFSAAGYRTVSLASNSLLSPELGLTRGFSRAEWLKRDEAVVEAAIQTLKAEDDRPLFLFVNLMAAHAPYTLAMEVPWSRNHARMLDTRYAPEWVKRYRLDRVPPALALSERPGAGELSGEEAYAKGTLQLHPADLRFISDLYDGELVRVDRAMVEIFGAWNARNPASGVVAVTSDHGEYLGEHGQIGHGFTVFDELTHVPLVLAAPGRLGAGLQVGTPVQLRDLYPTLLDLSGISPNHPGSLVPIASGQPRAGPIQAAGWPMAVFSRNVGGRFAVGHRLFRMGSDALVFDTVGEAALFDLGTDPDMSHDRAAAESERVNALLAEAADAFPQVVTKGALEVPDEALMQLKALGYTE